MLPWSSAPVDLLLNLSAAWHAFNHSWSACFGSGHAQLGTRVDWRDHLATAHAELGIKGLRMHGWLDDDMSVAPAPGGPFHFYNIDLVVDHLVSLGLKPIFELDYMPRSMADCKGRGDGANPARACTYAFHNRGGYKGLLEPPSDYSLWYDLVYELAAHLVGRHGIEELASWRFEVWNVICLAVLFNSGHTSELSHDTMQRPAMLTWRARAPPLLLLPLSVLIVRRSHRASSAVSTTLCSTCRSTMPARAPSKPSIVGCVWEGRSPPTSATSMTLFGAHTAPAYLSTLSPPTFTPAGTRARTRRPPHTEGCPLS
jgi:hypothetical protein